VTAAPLRVLVVDDSDTVRALVAMVLADAGHDVDEAADGLRALELARAAPPDVVLLDLQMPVLDGWGVLAALRADPELAEVPVVVLTQADDPGSVATALDRGADDHLRKPFDPVELLARVRAAGRTGQLVAQLRQLNVQLDRVARTDALTGLANRREVDRRLRDPASGAATVLLLDVDHFKAVNDGHGHAAGDAVLRAVADRLRAAVRDADVIGRWGGEEFVVLLRGAVLADGVAVAERVLAAVRAPLPPDVGPAAVTASIGVAQHVAGQPGGVEAALRRADDALYRAKAAGRDRVEAEVAGGSDAGGSDGG
jgi:two-component system, cell cycle response regulator